LITHDTKEVCTYSRDCTKLGPFTISLGAFLTTLAPILMGVKGSGEHNDYSVVPKLPHWNPRPCGTVTVSFSMVTKANGIVFQCYHYEDCFNPMNFPEVVSGNQPLGSSDHTLKIGYVNYFLNLLNNNTLATKLNPFI
jgi:hypothetical protein